MAPTGVQMPCEIPTIRPQPAPLRLGPNLSLWPPLLAAPMAGISCAPYRNICTAHGATLATSEMVIASALVLRNRRTLKLASFAPDEKIRSIQLYGVRPDQLQQVVPSGGWREGAGHVIQRAHMSRTS